MLTWMRILPFKVILLTQKLYILNSDLQFDALPIFADAYLAGLAIFKTV